MVAESGLAKPTKSDQVSSMEATHKQIREIYPNTGISTRLAQESTQLAYSGGDDAITLEGKYNPDVQTTHDNRNRK